MLKLRAYQIIIHIAGWLLFMALPLLFLYGGQSSLGVLLSVPYYWLFCFTYIFLFYFNAYLLIPRLFLRRKYAWYIVVTILLLVGIYLLKPYDLLLSTQRNRYFIYMLHHRSPMQDRLSGYNMPPPLQGEPGLHPGDTSYRFGPPNSMHGPFGPPMARQFPFRPFDSVSFFLFLMIMALSTAIKIIQQWQMTEQRASQAEADKASAELSFLKAQINPHFLFNTLNNIYTLAVMKDEHAPDSIMKLSNIMRYVTDDATANFVPLQDEINCINDYIELQRLRIGEKTSIDLYISGDIENKQIAPLILMTFIENVFKYGISKHTRSAIVIKIMGNETGISFFCQNRIFPEKDEKQRTGIGLKNTKQRLAHLYPGKYKLDIDTEAQLYTVKLMLQTL
ncbi:sensor histidine kinase [Mucilaginibacter sp. McL0603]|uniref:sensor histidine kinase n=1 Tax=Mucilaginibacter sp. McL0603 TaxID=3415670 RepID=UPI003CEAE980